MARILFTTTPITGHVRPGLPVARELVADGHEVAWYTGRKFADAVQGVGARYVPMTAGRDYDDSRLTAEVHGEGEQPNGIVRLRKDVLSLFVEPVTDYLADLDAVFATFRPDVVVADHTFLGGLFAAEKHGVPAVAISVTPLVTSSIDTAPFGLGLRPSASAFGHLRNRVLNWVVRSVVFADSQRAAAAIRRAAGLRSLPGYFMDWGLRIATAYVQPTVPEFEYPRSDLPAPVEFVGAILPSGVDQQWTPPAWWPDLADARRHGRPVVLVTQGTIAVEHAHLLLPTVSALAGADVLVVATTGGADPDDVLAPADRPANLRLERFVPYSDLLPFVDVMVTNGGYGGVQMSLAAGVPLVVAGTTEDKAEVNARVEWAGVGVSLRTDTPSPDQIADGVRRVLGGNAYRDRARALAPAYAGLGGAARVAQIVADVAADDWHPAAAGDRVVG